MPANSKRSKEAEILSSYNIALSVDCVVFGYDNVDHDLKILLIKSETEAFKGKWSLLGDLVEEHESLKTAAKRILKKRTGLENVYLEQVEAFSDPKRHPSGRVVTIAYYSLIQIEDYKIDLNQLDLVAQWHSVSNVRKLAFDHNEILKVCLKQLKKGLRESPVGFSLLPKKFSLKQLQNLYEVVLDIDIDKRNFRRKLRTNDILLQLNETQKAVTHRPAVLYKFDKKKYKKLIKEGKRFNIP